ncbi:ciliary microtubule inner protein 5-like isoform X2 [Convolutriloba macropyga]
MSSTSERHMRCIPADQAKQLNESPAAAALGTVFAESRTGIDERVDDDIWKGVVEREKWCENNWKTNWGFLVEKMREIEPPECSSRRPKTAFAPDSREVKTPFSQRIPNTRATEFGSRLNTNIGSEMANMQFEWGRVNRKKKMDSSIAMGAH